MSERTVVGLKPWLPWPLSRSPWWTEPVRAERLAVLRIGATSVEEAGPESAERERKRCGRLLEGRSVSVIRGGTQIAPEGTLFKACLFDGTVAKSEWLEFIRWKGRLYFRSTESERRALEYWTPFAIR